MGKHNKGRGEWDKCSRRYIEVIKRLSKQAENTVISFSVLKPLGWYLFKWRVDITEKETNREPTPLMNKILQLLFLPDEVFQIPADVCRRKAQVWLKAKHGFEEMSL